MPFKAFAQFWRSSPAGTSAIGAETAVIMWHLGWAGVMIFALIISLITGQGRAALALLAVAAPGLTGIALTRYNGPVFRRGLLFVWALAAWVCVSITGALQSPFLIWLILPLLAAVALNQRALISYGAVLSLIVSVAAMLTGSSAPVLTGAAVYAALAVLSTVLALSTALMPALRARVARAEDAEDKSGTFLRYLTEQPHLILSLEDDGRITGAFGEAPEGLSRSELVSLGLIGCAHPPDRARITDAITEALSGGRAEVGFHPQARLDHYWRLSLRATEEGQLFGTLRDATLSHARSESLEAARAEAEALNQSKSRFLANMSHELRTPLNAVIGFSDIMRLKLFGPISDKYAEYAQLIWTSGQHVLDLINDVLDMSKIEAQKYTLSLEPFDAREAVSQALSLVRVQAHDARIELKTLMPPEPLMVEADMRALKQICLNLLSNALKFTPAGGAVTLIVEEADPHSIEIVIADTGVGIAPDDLSRLGQPYEQSGSAEQKALGTGLGLSLVQALSQLHGGQMSIESTLGVGTSVRVVLPVRLPVTDEIAELETPEPIAEGDGLSDRDRVPARLEGTADLTVHSKSS